MYWACADYFHQDVFKHWYSAVAETYRAFTELGQVWQVIGNATSRDDVFAHGVQLVGLAPQLYHDLHASMNMTADKSKPGQACYADQADGPSVGGGCIFRSYSELFYSGALTAEQTKAIYTSGLGLSKCSNGAGRFLSLGAPAGGTRMFVHIPQGFPFGLLCADMVEEFLLYFFTQSAHLNTRGTFTTPESTTLDRDAYDYAYGSAGLFGHIFIRE